MGGSIARVAMFQGVAMRGRIAYQSEWPPMDCLLKLPDHSAERVLESFGACQQRTPRTLRSEGT